MTAALTWVASIANGHETAGVIVLLIAAAYTLARVDSRVGGEGE